MHRLNHKKFAGTYFGQGILSVLLLAAALYLAYTSAPAQALFPPSVSELTQLNSENYIARHPIVKIHCDELSYTGYDNQTGRKTTGHYYYTIQDGKFLYVLLDAQESAPAQTLKDYTCTVRLINDQTLYHKLIGQFAETMDWSSDSLLKMSLPVIASQPDCHLSSTILFTIALILCTCIFLISAVLNFYHYHKCRQHIRQRRRTHRPSSGQLSR